MLPLSSTSIPLKQSHLSGQSPNCPSSVPTVPQLRRYRNYCEERDSLEQQIRQEEERYPVLMKRIDELQHDPATIERVAREKLGLARPGETVFRFRTPPEEAYLPPNVSETP